jgi:hypothetical protein
MRLIGAKQAKSHFAHQNKAKNTPRIPSWCTVVEKSSQKVSVAILDAYSANLLQLAGA